MNVKSRTDSVKVVTPDAALIKAGYAQAIRDWIEADPSAYERHYGVAKAAKHDVPEVHSGLDGYAQALVDKGDVATKEQAVAEVLRREADLYDQTYGLTKER